MAGLALLKTFQARQCLESVLLSGVVATSPVVLLEQLEESGITGLAAMSHRCLLFFLLSCVVTLASGQESVRELGKLVDLSLIHI